MTIVVDTSVLIDLLRGDTRASQALETARAGGELLTGSVLTRTELLAGMHPGEERSILRLFASLPWIEVDHDLADRAGRLTNEYRRSHPGIDPVDYVIAATANRLDAQLWTHNLKHFPMFPGLQPPY